MSGFLNGIYLAGGLGFAAICIGLGTLSFALLPSTAASISDGSTKSYGGRTMKHALVLSIVLFTLAVIAGGIAGACKQAYDPTWSVQSKEQR